MQPSSSDSTPDVGLQPPNDGVLDPASAPDGAAGARHPSFLANVLWNWVGVAATMFSAVVLSPYIVRKLGPDAFGVWALVFSLMDYYWLLDLGLRSATVKYTAEYSATGQPGKINTLVNTALVYFSGAMLVLIGVSLLLARYAHRFFQIPAQFQGAFAFLIAIAGICWSVATVFNTFQACTEGLQRFDISSRIWIVTTTLRAVGCAVVLWLGYGLREMGIMLLASMVAGYAMSFLGFLRVFPQFRFSPASASWRTLREMAGYGLKTFFCTVGSQVLDQTAPLLIGHFRPVAFVGYYSVPVRLLVYTGQLVERMGAVTNAKSAELAARFDWDAVRQLAVLTNRYSLALFMPIALFFVVYPRELIGAWLGPDFAANSSAILPVLTVATLIGVASQLNSSRTLYGMGKHQSFAWGLLVEAAAGLALLLYAVPRFGILGAAWVSAVLMVLDRGVFVPWALCRELRTAYLPFMASIYARPAAATVPVLGLCLWLKARALPGDSWLEMLIAAAIIAAAYYALAFLYCLEKVHQVAGIDWARRRLAKARASAAG